MKTFALSTFIGTIAFFGTISLFIGCVSGEQCVECVPDVTETVTRATIQFVPINNTSDTLSGSLHDPSYALVFSGVGQTVTLEANTDYQLLLDLWNEQKNPPEHISSKIALEEAVYHQCFYEVQSELAMTLEYADADSLGKPIGLKMTAQTGGASSDTLDIILMLEVNGKDNDLETGDQEINVHFPLIIE